MSDSSSPPPSSPRGKAATADQLRARVAELEAELAASRHTVEILLERADRQNSPRSASDSGVMATSVAAAAQDAASTASVDDSAQPRGTLEAVNHELRALTSNLDQIVRSRTRALAESEAQLRHKNSELERQGTAKAEFISIVAHELRTPLTSIVGYLELVAEGRFGDPPEAMVRPLTSLSRSAHRLKRLVDEMLDVSRIDAGRVSLERSTLDLGVVARDVVAELSLLARAKQQTATTNCASPIWVDGDLDKLHRIIVNLMSNAIRYTPNGGEITISIDDAPADRYPGGWARIRVRDTGIGIAETERHRIFEPFTDARPVKHHSSSEPGSSGLGLYIARGLIEVHGGLITVDSEVGLFTEFTVLLPHRRA